MSKEYTYDIDKYTIGVDENGEDGIGMTVAKIENGEIKFLGNCYGENARCIDLLIKENQELKKQYCERTDCSGRIGNSKKVEELQKENKQLQERIEYLERSNNRREDIILEQRQEINNLETQQKEFIEMLEKEILDSKAGSSQQYYAKEHLRLFKEIIGGK